MGLKLILLLIGVVTASMAGAGLIQGRVYCKGGPFWRSTQPVAFWLSIAVYVLWSALMMYFAFFGHPR